MATHHDSLVSGPDIDRTMINASSKKARAVESRKRSGTPVNLASAGE